MMTNQIKKTEEQRRPRPRRQRQNAVLNLEDIWGPCDETNNGPREFPLDVIVAAAPKPVTGSIKNNIRLGNKEKGIPEQSVHSSVTRKYQPS
jgi:hypothetical protein